MNWTNVLRTALKIACAIERQIDPPKVGLGVAETPNKSYEQISNDLLNLAVQVKAMGKIQGGVR